VNKDGHVLNAALLSLGVGVILSLDPATLQTPGRVLRMGPASLLEGSIVDVGTQVAQLSLPVILGALFPDVDTAFGRHRKTLHNLPVLSIFLVFPYVFGNLHFVWIGVGTHYILDVVGSRRGIALFYPLSSTEYDISTGVTTTSRWSQTVTIGITVGEIIVLFAIHAFLVPLDDPSVITQTVLAVF
jgi:hypothetical protein